MQSPGGDVQNMKSRGWVALFSSAFTIVIISAIWLVLAKALAEHRLTSYDAGTAEFFGRVFTAFALIVISGLLGVASSIVQIRSGRRSRVLTIAVVIVFIAAVGTVVIAVNGRHP